MIFQQFSVVFSDFKWIQVVSIFFLFLFYLFCQLWLLACVNMFPIFLILPISTYNSVIWMKTRALFSNSHITACLFTLSVVKKNPSESVTIIKFLVSWMPMFNNVPKCFHLFFAVLEKYYNQKGVKWCNKQCTKTRRAKDLCEW